MQYCPLFSYGPGRCGDIGPLTAGLRRLQEGLRLQVAELKDQRQARRLFLECAAKYGLHANRPGSVRKLPAHNLCLFLEKNFFASLRVTTREEQFRFETVQEMWKLFAEPEKRVRTIGSIFERTILNLPDLRHPTDFFADVLPVLWYYLKREGELHIRPGSPHEVVDLSGLHDFLQFDGVNYVLAGSDLAAGASTSFELGCIFEIGRMIHEKGVRFKGLTGKKQ